ncbi:hypothetical protein KP509_33G037800 [Ceratopteris richardii]|uniref:Transmembrane protein n=1 Tax=Ceratopteris richardii TaxID=49495 RepID=A0A8T2QPT4_CERRI|nr:hypothetical protein KP509_33G037800 [Ceratopteris richardii]
MMRSPSLVVLLTYVLSAAVVFCIAPAVNALSLPGASFGSDSVIFKHSQPVHEGVNEMVPSSRHPLSTSASFTHLHRRMLPRVPVPPSAPSTGHNSMSSTDKFLRYECFEPWHHTLSLRNFAEHLQERTLW